MNQNDGSSSISISIQNKKTYRKRKKTLKKKAEELSVLCDLPVALITIDPTGKVDTWPEDRRLVAHILRDYLHKTTNVKDRNPNSDGERRRRKKKRKLMYDTWPSELDYWPEEALLQILEEIETKLKIFDQIVLGEGDDLDMLSNT
ncbi:AGAMOUS-like 82 [Euphorbia peplus]|nr:AGAMOUS-like 82 [Euphorbia peplus]